MWKKLKFSQRNEKSEDDTKSPWYERYEKSNKVRKVHGTNRPCIRKVYGTKSLAFHCGINFTVLLCIIFMCNERNNNCMQMLYVPPNIIKIGQHLT